MKGSWSWDRGYLQKVGHRQRCAGNVDECFEVATVQPALIEGVTPVHVLVWIDRIQNDTRIQVLYFEGVGGNYLGAAAAQ